MKKIESAHDVFWLARYAHNTLDPLIKAAKQYDPSIWFKTELVFGRVTTWNPTGFEVNIAAHWDGPLMFLHELGLTTKAQVDKVAAKVQEFIDAEQAKPLETAIPA